MSCCLMIGGGGVFLVWFFNFFNFFRYVIIVGISVDLCL